jgi:hypothetical protein
MAAGPLPSVTQAMAGSGLVGSCGAANTAPSGLSAAVTRSAANGSAIGAPGCSGPVVATGGGVDVGVVDADVAPCGWVVVLVLALDEGDEGLELHAAKRIASSAIAPLK